MKVERKKRKIDYFIAIPLPPLFVSVITFVLIFFILPSPAHNLYAGEQLSSSNVNIVVDGPIGPPSSFGLEKMSQAFKERGLSPARKGSIGEAQSPFVILIGTLKGSNVIKDLRGKGKLSLADKKESLAVKRLKDGGKDLLVIAGADDRGLMYALLEIARQA
ncbi:MAG: hypothetical protein MUP52_12520, partial [Candidatus Aminicenantes bacterium]|nr:hypothetical protein [Candidatus Aminicenantes bacterium]